MPKQYKIACLGCSWTEGINDPSDGKKNNLAEENTYPFKLQKFLSTHGRNTQMIQAGRAGSGVEYCHLVADYLLNEFNPDIFVIQLTTHDRSILALDPKYQDEKRIRWSYDTINNTYHKVWQLSDNLINLSPGLGASASSHNESNQYTDLLVKMYNEKIKDKMAPEVSFSDYKNYIALWWEQSCNTDFQKYFYYSHIYSLVDHLQEQEKIVIPFYWLKWKPEFKTKLFQNRQYPSIQGMMGNKVFDSYLIDKGYHFSPEGNAKLVEDFLGPTILETM